MTRAGEPTIGVVIPTRNAARWLERTLAVLRAEPELVELLVIDSGSSDGTPEIAAREGARVVSIKPREFGHGRTRNLAMELTEADLVCFLTQDAVPLPGWLGSWRPAFARHPRIGAAFGPQLPWPDTPVPVARELDEFFPRFAHPAAPDEPAVLGSLDDPFLSNVNACYRRDCWREVRFPDVPYGEDRAFALAMREAGWYLAYVPRARVRHAHAYPPLQFARRYFDEFRALALVFGYRERWLDPVALTRRVLGETLRDVRWARKRRDLGAVAALTQAPRWALHHLIRATVAPLGSRGLALPAPLQRMLSLEGRAIRRGESAAVIPSAGDRDAGKAALAVGRVEPRGAADPYLCGRLEREGPAPTRPRPVHASNGDRPLHIAFVVPPWERGSGGHMTILRFVRYLEQQGHTVTLWLHDPRGERQWAWNGVLRHSIVSDFIRVRAPVFNGFDHWHGADVAVATGWETAYCVLLLPDVGDRVYLVQDHEPDFFPASAERVLAERTYTFPELRIITAGRWLSEFLRDRYGVESDFFSLGVDHDVYKPDPRVERIPMSIAMYGRFVTGRRGVPLARDAIGLLWERGVRPRVFVFGTEDPPGLPFPYEFVGVAPPARLARLYNEVTVGIALSLTNYSLVPLEMLACGLPVVDINGGSLERELGRSSGALYAAATPEALASRISDLLYDAELFETLSRQGVRDVQSLSWQAASQAFEATLLRAVANANARDT